MIAADLGTVAEAMDGVLMGGEEDSLVCGAATDSRMVRRGELFFALKGRTDGAAYAEEAQSRGAVAVVADRPLRVPTVVVEDPQRALQTLARWNLRCEQAPIVVGITGSVGKTTTKDALAAILRSAGRRVTATEGNFNNEIGLPLTVLTADERTEVLVLEMGATHRGDIARLCEIAPPQVGILTAVSPVHLESFGSLEGLAAVKGELAQALPHTGALIAPATAPEISTAMGRRLNLRLVFGESDSAGLRALDINQTGNNLYFKVRYMDGSMSQTAEVKTPVYGTHLVEPLLAAIGGGLALGLSLEDCAKGLGRLRRTGMRGEVYRLRNDIVVYDDSYNASPAAVAAVLRYGAEQAMLQGGRFVAVLGGMFELGAGARAYHREAGAIAEEVGVGLLVCVGEEARWYAEGFAGETRFYPDAKTAGKELPGELKDMDYVAIKGSRGVGLDVLTLELKESLSIV